MPNPTYIEAGNRAALWLAKRTGGVAQSMLLEALANIPSTAHILGGAVIGRDAATGVVDGRNRAFGYREPAGVRRLDGAGQSRRESQPHHHRARGARHEPRAREGSRLGASMR